MIERIPVKALGRTVMLLSSEAVVRLAELRLAELRDRPASGDAAPSQRVRRGPRLGVTRASPGTDPGS